MIIKANTHLGFNCKNQEKAVWFYEKILGCKRKFTLHYGDLIPEDKERLKTIPTEMLEEWKKYKDVIWFTYLEWIDGYFIELFNTYTAHIENKVDSTKNYGYTHFAFVVEDMQQFYQELLVKGAEEYIDRTPEPALDGNYTMWIHDPEGNAMEIQQYTEASMQLGGKGFR